MTMKCSIPKLFGSGVVVAIRRALAYEAGTSFEDLVAFGTKNEKYRPA